MNENFWIDFLKKRMEQQGVDGYYFEPFTLYAEPTEKSFRLDNGYLYLVGEPLNVIIESDTSFYMGTAARLSENPVSEFTGLISYKAVGGREEPQVLRFVRVHIQYTKMTSHE